MNFVQRYQPALSWVSEINRFIDRNATDPLFTAGPREAFYESDNAWILRLDLPGYNKEEVAVTVTDRVMQLTAESAPDKPFAGKFERQWNLGDDIDATGVNARLENGVLEITLPKRPEVVPVPTTIEIK